MEKVFELRRKDILMIKNNEKVKFIKMYPKAKCFCPIGEAWYTNQFEIELIIDDEYCDYLDVKNFVKKEIEGQVLTIEKACYKLYEYFKMQKFKKVKIVSNVNDATHFDVEVICGD